MSDSTNAFLRRHEKKSSKLAPWTADIAALLGVGISYAGIAQYLLEQGVVASRTEIHHFMHRRIRRHLIQIKEAHASRPDNANCPAPAAPPAAAPQATTTPQAKEPGALPKFTWRARGGDDEPKW